MSRAGFEALDLSLNLGSFALRGVSLAAEPGEALVLLGPNGAGKSVCLEAIAGFHQLGGGRIHIAGRDVTALPPEERRVGFVVQNFGLFPHLTVIENVALGCRARGNDCDTGAMLARFGIAHLAGAKPTHLSPGEKQRVALARALASRSDLFLFDEPFAALDAATSLALRAELGGFLRQSALPAIFVTHDHAEARAIADRVAIIEGGVIQQRGRADDVFDHPASVAIARFLGIENLLEGRVAAVAADHVRVSLDAGFVDARKSGKTLSTGQTVTICIRAENVHLLPPQSAKRPGAVEGRVTAIARSGPLWMVSVGGGFPLTAYALPQTAQACGLAPGAPVDIAIDPAAIHIVSA